MIQERIEHVNSITDEAIAQLEAQKRDLRGGINPNFPIIQKNIQDITLGHDRIVEKLLQQQTDVKERKASLEVLDYTICELDREISRIQSERDRTVVALVKKKDDLRKVFSSADDVTSQIRKLDDQIEILTEDHGAQMEKLNMEKEELMNREDLTASEKELALAELERKIAEKEETYQEHMQSLENQKGESMVMMKEYDEEIATATKNNLTTQIEDLELMKVGASPSEVEAINDRISKLKEQIEDIETLGEMKARGLRITSSGRIATEDGQVVDIEEAREKGLLEGLDVMKLLVKNKLKQQGLRMTRSGTLRTLSGRLITLDEAKELGLIGDSTIDAYNIAMGKRSSVSLLSSGGSDMSSEDVHYLKVAVGKPLTLALAEICAKQPRDPIHYLGHWLFKYRYNQEVDVCKKQEIEELMEERERIRLETWHRAVEDAAKAAVLDMVYRAHDEAMEHELQAQALAAMLSEEGAEEENDELAEEAKDVLGEYNGPPAGQRRI